MCALELFYMILPAHCLLFRGKVLEIDQLHRSACLCIFGTFPGVMRFYALFQVICPNALRKDKTTQPPHYVVIFKSKDADNLEQAFREFTAKTLSKEQRPSIRKVLSAMKKKTAEQTKQRAKEKIRERGLER